MNSAAVREMDREPTRILLLMHELTLTGAPKLAIGIFRDLVPKRQLMIHALEGGPLETEFRSIGDLTVLSSTLAPHYAEAAISRKATMRVRDGIRTAWARRRARRWGPDIIYVNSTHALMHAARIDLTGVPILLHVHEAAVALADYDDRHPGLIGTIPDRYVAVTGVVAGELTRGYGVSSDRIVVVPPFTEVPERTGETIRVARSKGTPHDPFIIGGMGNPSWFKGHGLWLLAAREVANALGTDAVRFVWVGVRDNEEGRHFGAMVSKLGLTSVIELVAETDDPYSFLRSFDLLAVSSWEESASLAALEAMAHGIPVVCFAGSGGPAELIGDAGHVVADFSPAALAEAIIHLVKDPHERRRLGIAARERVLRDYGRPAAVRRIAEEIEAAINRVATT